MTAGAMRATRNFRTPRARSSGNAGRQWPAAPSRFRPSGFGGTRPLVSNASASGREQNRRVEIVISGPSIGGMALWDRTYSLSSRH